ncbi:hypothetical protein C1T17_03410 [Sphingobium sp. SCG-1]|nr:hypothetical protein C1T17_03410 [Sphingobium sp. SCG-1]
MMNVLAKLAHRDGYSVHVDPAQIERTGMDQHGPIVVLHDGTILKLRPVLRASKVLPSKRQAVLAKAH